jgi:hypothetical protein
VKAKGEKVSTVQISRVWDPKIIPQLSPHFTVETEEERPLVAAQLASLLQQNPEAVFLVTAVLEGEVVAFIIAHNLQNLPYTFVAQAWSADGNPLRIADELFLRVMVWTSALGKREVRAETGRNPTPFYRRVGLEPVRTILRREVPEDLNRTLYSRARDLVRPQVAAQEFE